MLDQIELAFPRLRRGDYQVTSPRTDAYNCIAWAAGDTMRWWWPDDPRGYWPEGAACLETLQAFGDAFATLGYVTCLGHDLESGFEKIALFADRARTPTHAARQLPNGRWTSKLGLLEDIEHGIHDLEGSRYGSIIEIMKRPLPDRGDPL
jgi:hypothetical protein